MIETIDWVPVAERLPDDGMMVLLCSDSADEPVWTGSRENGCWYWTDCAAAVGVTHWAQMPAGPRG